jgi:hypothetical protein
MTRVLLTGVAVLFLATGTAHAGQRDHVVVSRIEGGASAPTSHRAIIAGLARAFYAWLDCRLNSDFNEPGLGC